MMNTQEATVGMQQKMVTLHAAYDNIKTVDPEGFGYKCLCNWLDLQSTENLKFIVGAKIKWVSSLALNRVNRRKA
jgi:hypothetical protein